MLDALLGGGGPDLSRAEYDGLADCIRRKLEENRPAADTPDPEPRQAAAGGC